ncbi:nucleotidyltransferase family protein [Phenylobacterium sp.]|uniref:nucleotidyltransferase family protein n=1 Tax=Phenylobacterium sp. TaxID=1871053 RepID=UPI0030F40B5B
MTGVGGFEAIVLAAGAGTRFGGGKLLAPYGDGVLLDGALRAAFSGPVRGVTVVTGSDPSRVGAVVMAHARQAGQYERLQIVHAVDHAEGMGASLRRAAAALPADTAGVFIFLGDMPRIPLSVLEPLAQAVRDGAPAAAATFGGKRGHPAVIGAAMISQLLTLTGDAGARALLQNLGDRLVLVEAPDDGVLFDVDQPADLKS